MNIDIISGIGSGLTVIGSILLAWRVKIILGWVHFTLVAHESSIRAIVDAINGGTQSFPIITGVNVHLTNTIENTGTRLLQVGFLFIGLGIVLQFCSLLLKY